LDDLFEYRGICPEVGIGMGVPRPPIALVAGEPIRAVAVADPSVDYTAALQAFGRQALEALAPVAGYLFMRGSPSCGLYRVKVHSADAPGGAAARRVGRGIYADTLARALPTLPMEETGRLWDPQLRENFVTRAFTYAHWQTLVHEGLDRARLIEFHSRYKYLLMAHSVPHYQQTGRLLSNLKTDFDERAEQYFGLLMAGLAHPASRSGHANVLAHLQGYLKRNLDAASRRALAGLIDAYRHDKQPLEAPLALLKAQLRTHPSEYLRYQVYLEPHPGRGGPPAQA
jgi:uncharacterized protein YbgA (DUF1722 family)/uncharacterized protein YbbK (DUF523 family)